MAVCSCFLLGVSVGGRDAEHADILVGQIALVLKSSPLFVVDNWKACCGAFLRIAHRVAVVNNVRDARGKLLRVSRFALYGTLKVAKKIILDSGVGRMIHVITASRGAPQPWPKASPATRGP